MNNYFSVKSPEIFPFLLKSQLSLPLTITVMILFMCFPADISFISGSSCLPSYFFCIFFTFILVHWTSFQFPHAFYLFPRLLNVFKTSKGQFFHLGSSSFAPQQCSQVTPLPVFPSQCLKQDIASTPPLK